MIGAIAFSFQIYCDFSGYTDIALGAAKLFGFELLTNFKFPYFSRDIAEFWRRWHISLSSWFRDYLYIPLGGSKQGKLNAIRNTFIIFLVSGFWHGASWNFIAWGFIHACGFLPLLILKRNRIHISEIVAHNRNLPNIKELVQMIGTFLFVTIAWIFFRTDNLKNAFGYIWLIIKNSYTNPSQFLHPPKSIGSLIILIPFILVEWWLRRDERNLRSVNSWLRYPLYIGMIYIIIVHFGGNTAFIYFQF